MFSFSHMVLPCDDNRLRNTTLDRIAFGCPKYENLPIDIENAMVEIFIKELELLHKMHVAKVALYKRYDFSTLGAFRAIDKRNDNSISVFNLAEFLNKSSC